MIFVATDIGGVAAAGVAIEIFGGEWRALIDGGRAFFQAEIPFSIIHKLGVFIEDRTRCIYRKLCQSVFAADERGVESDVVLRALSFVADNLILK